MKKLAMPDTGLEDYARGSAIERLKAKVGGHHKALEEIIKTVNSTTGNVDTLSEGLITQKTLIEDLQDRIDFLELPWYKRIFRREEK